MDLPAGLLGTLSTNAPSLFRHYPASTVLRAFPSPHTAQPDSHELPVDPRPAITAGASRVAPDPLCLHAVATTPAGPRKPVRSYRPLDFVLPRLSVGSVPALIFSRPAQRSLALRPTSSRGRLRDPFHRRLQQLCCLHRRFDCYRVKRTSSRAGLSPAVDQRLSRRTD